jgi:voltage-gated potassium channel
MPCCLINLLMKRLRKRIHHILEFSKGQIQQRGSISWMLNVVLITIIFLNAIAIVLHTVPEYNQKYERLFIDFEYFSVAVFTIEYCLRIWSCVEKEEYRHPLWGRLKYISSLSAMVDLLAISPFYITQFTSDLALIRVLRLFRIFRLFKISKYALAVDIIKNVIKDKREELIVSVVFILFMLLISSSIMYYIEHTVQPKTFSSIPATMWWGVSTLTTVGYGDAVPKTGLGKFFGGIIALMGVGLFTLPTGILASGFAEELSKRNAKKRFIRCPHCGQQLDINLQLFEHQQQHTSKNEEEGK